MEWDIKEVNSGNINGGERYENGDGILASDLNAIVGNSLFAVDSVKKAEFTAEAVSVNAGLPAEVEVISTATPASPLNKKFKFKLPKGVAGEKGAQGEIGVQGDKGVSALMINRTLASHPETLVNIPFSYFNRIPAQNEYFVAINVFMGTAYIALMHIMNIYNTEQIAQCGFYLSQRVTGEKGDKGDVGTQGPKGEDGTEVPDATQTVKGKALLGASGGAARYGNAADVGMGNVTNESKAAMFTNAILTGTPTAPTAATATNSTQIATTAFVNDFVSDKIGICTTASGTVAKTVTIPNTTIDNGTMVIVKFTNANTAASPTLSVNNSTAAPMYRGSLRLSGSYLTAGTFIFTWNGTNWINGNDATQSQAMLGSGLGRTIQHNTNGATT